MTQLWSPNTILNLSQDGRCVGHAPSKGRKCLTPIGYDNLKRVVSEIATQEPDADLLRSKLRCMAQHGLCRRYHQYQVDDMVDKWTSRIRAAFPPPPPARRMHRHADRSVASSRASSIAPRSVASVSSSRPEHSEIQTLQETIAAMQETIRVAQRQLERLQYTSPSESSLSRVDTDDISTLRLSRSSSMQSVTTTRSETIRSVAPTAPVRSTRVETPAATRAEEHTPRPIATRCSRTHVRRLPVDEECAICYDEEHLSERAPEDIVWCKSGCGKSVHRECFEAWQASCVQESRAATCTHCRTRWVDECAC
ncbi:hypothetical protein FB567DRAFT_239378 [Paraphoma chrysanthemicola]|uniref:RING-type domain-containing protein n=1 Tax=Paraphoma chrysanthemicola TaxID=798071 RepID=A0A8K0W2H1_9PLEO|nr:hypothetical protein FB567DRAFT_239378 [Paraphoma chrysanthemicola]